VPAAAVVQHAVTVALADSFPVAIAIAIAIAIAVPVAFPVTAGVRAGEQLRLGGRPERRSQCLLHRRSERDRLGRPVAVGVVLGLGITFAIGVRCPVIRCPVIRRPVIRRSVIRRSVIRRSVIRRSVVVREFIVGQGHGLRVTRRLPRDEPEPERDGNRELERDGERER